MKKVIYLTGAPAAGKSSTTQLLAKQCPSLVVWEYGSELTKFIKLKRGGVEDQNDLRKKSSKSASSADIAELDEKLLKFVKERRGFAPVLIDSHPVTKEEFGFRITAFSLAQIQSLSPDEIWLLYASPSETRRRIKADPGGRPLISLEQARMHTALQASVAANYGAALGKPVYLFDTEMPREQLVRRLLERLS